jgi:hypothetical protein
LREAHDRAPVGLEDRLLDALAVVVTAVDLDASQRKSTSTSW